MIQWDSCCAPGQKCASFDEETSNPAEYTVVGTKIRKPPFSWALKEMVNVVILASVPWLPDLCLLSVGV